ATSKAGGCCAGSPAAARPASPPRSSRSCRGGCAQHGAHDAVVGATSTQVAVERSAHRALVGLRVRFEERRRADHDSREAIAALARLLLEKRALEAVGLLFGSEALHRRDFL